MSDSPKGKLAELNQEIRSYPGPIARCDEQLTALLEQRAALLRQLEAPATCSPEAIWTNDGGR
jgi:chorismate mutase